MSETIKFEDLTKEQQNTVKKAAKKLFFKGLVTGSIFGLLLFICNLSIIMINEAFIKSMPTMFILCMVVDIYILQNMRAYSRENNQEFANVIKQILNEK